MIKKTVLSIIIGLLLANSYSYPAQLSATLSQTVVSQIGQTIRNHPIATVTAATAVTALVSVVDNYMHQSCYKKSKTTQLPQEIETDQKIQQKRNVILFSHGLRPKPKSGQETEAVEGVYGHLSRLLTDPINNEFYVFKIDNFEKVMEPYNDNRIDTSIQNYPAVSLPAYAFIYNDTKEGPSASDLGQKVDIRCFFNAISLLIHENTKIVLYCQSRGGAAAINCLAKHPELQEHISGIIIESSFHNPHSAIYQKIATRLKIPLLASFILPRFLVNFGIKRIFPLFNPQAKTPIENIHAIDQNIPMLFLATTRDKTVPWQSTKKLHDARFAMNPNKTSWHLDTESNHCHMVENQNYKDAVENFLKKIATNLVVEG